MLELKMVLKYVNEKQKAEISYFSLDEDKGKEK